jgi:hypothetical protein
MISKETYENDKYPRCSMHRTLNTWLFAVGEQVRIDIFDVLGRHVETLINTEMAAGKYEIPWNAARYASGVYLYRLSTAQFSLTKKLTLIK